MYDDETFIFNDVANFAFIHGEGKVATVGKKIGGKVGANIELGEKDPNLGFTNACAIRISYSLNYSGSPIARGVWSTVTGGDRKSYIYRVKDLSTYLRQKFGSADKTVKSPKPADFAGLARFPLERNRSSDKKSRKIKTLERIPIEKVWQLFRNSL